MKEKQPMSMEDYADRITTQLSLSYDYSCFTDDYLWGIVFDAIQLFQDLQDEKNRNLKEEYQERKLEKERQEGK